MADSPPLRPEGAANILQRGFGTAVTLVRVLSPALVVTFALAFRDAKGEATYFDAFVRGLVVQGVAIFFFVMAVYYDEKHRALSRAVVDMTKIPHLIPAALAAALLFSWIETTHLNALTRYERCVEQYLLYGTPTGNRDRIADRLYECRSEAYPEPAGDDY